MYIYIKTFLHRNIYAQENVFVQATLNARTAVLAAANPRDGRYDPSKPLRGNIGTYYAIYT